jgi:hypothetical protein
MWCDVMWRDVTVTVSFHNWVHLNWTTNQETSLHHACMVSSTKLNDTNIALCDRWGSHSGYVETSLCCVCWRKKPKCWGSILHPSLGQSEMAAVCCSKTPISIRQHTLLYARRTKCVYFVTVGMSRLTAYADSPAIHAPSAPVLNSKLLCTAATVVNATSHFMVQLPQQSHTVCNC